MEWSAEHYRYMPVEGGFEIVNGPSIYNRPLYGPHCEDLDRFDERLLAVAGDSPDALLLLINWRIPGGGGCAAAKMGHLFLGLGGVSVGNAEGTDSLQGGGGSASGGKDPGESGAGSASGGKWLNAFQRITARYVSGRQEYELQDACIRGTVHLTYVRPVSFEGLLARVRMPETSGGQLVIACGGPTSYAGGRHYDYQEGRGSPKDFHVEDCGGSEIAIKGNSFSIRKPQEGHGRTCFGTASVPLTLSARDASALQSGPAHLLEAPPAGCPVAVGHAVIEPGQEFYLVVTTDRLDDPEVEKYLKAPKETFDACCRHYEELSQCVRIETPDRYLDLGFAAQVLALDSSWHDPCFTHGPWSWATPHAGWRVCYGPTVLGWHERVRKSTAAFFPGQAKEPEHPALAWQRPDGYVQGHVCRGAVPDVAGERSFFYNMGEVLLDQILYDWEWTADLDFMEKAFDFIADKLLWEERLLDADGDGLYENWLNTWVSDAHWYNGGGGIQASVYNWRANAVMADAARRLGKDPAVFEKRAAKIATACEQKLWVPERGIYAEYQDVMGRKLLHAAPEQASIYHPIDFGFCDALKSFQMLAYAEREFRSEIGTVPRAGRLMWSSNWLPVLYSSLGLYPQETINLMLCYYRLGLVEKADELLRGVEASFFMGPCPGGLAHNQRPDGSHFGSTDFTDTSSMFVRVVVEGLFGIRMNAPAHSVSVQPGFPEDWKRASIDAPDLSYRYSWDGNRERLAIHTPRKLDYRVRLRARTAGIRFVRVDGRKARFTTEPGIGHSWVTILVPDASSASVEIAYAPGAPAAIEADPVAAIGERYAFRVPGGTIAELYDPQGITKDVALEETWGNSLVPPKPGRHVFFVRARAATGRQQAEAWLPAAVELRAPVEITDPALYADGFRLRCSCRLANNTQHELRLAGVLSIGGSRRFIDGTIPGLDRSEKIDFGISDPSRLTPGSNLLEAQLGGDHRCSIAADAVDWNLAGRSAAVRDSVARARAVDLGPVVNEELVLLHGRSYLEPRPRTYSIMVKENGRSIWDWNARGFGVVDPRLDRLTAGPDAFVSDVGVSFAVPRAGKNVVVVSAWENYPSLAKIPVGLRGRKIYFLVVASTNPMQSRMENAQIRVVLDGGETRVLPLVNPDNLDDWLSVPFAENGYVQPLGEATHGLILDMDIGGERFIERVELECLCNEVLVGALGVTVI